MRPKVLITNPLGIPAIQYLKKHADIAVRYDLDTRALLRCIKNFDALIVRSGTPVSAPVLSEGKRGKLKIVATATAGFNHIDVPAAKQLGIVLVYSPWGNAVANAEFIIGSMIALARGIVMQDRRMRKGEWNHESGVGPELFGKTFGTIGFGRIGNLAAERARLFGMRVLAYDPAKSEYEGNAHGVHIVPLKELLKKSDFISLSVPLNEHTHGLIAKEELKYVKRNVYIIQSSRGGIIDERALLHVLMVGRIAGATIDVFEKEPCVLDDFKKLDNVILTPHIGCASTEARIRSGLSVGRDIINFFKNKPLANVLS